MKIRLHGTEDECRETPEQVRTACGEFSSALDLAEDMIRTYRVIVARFREAGTFEVSPKVRAKLASIDGDEQLFKTMDRLDNLGRGGAQ